MTYLLVLIATLPLLLSRFPFRNHSIQGDGLPDTLHLNLSLPFVSTLRSPMSPRILGALAFEIIEIIQLELV